MSKKIKLYSVKFLRYDDVLKRTVSDWDGSYQTSLQLHTYVDTEYPLIVRESDLPYYQKFGGGFDSIQFVGYLGIPETSSADDSVSTVTTQIHDDTGVFITSENMNIPRVTDVLYEHPETFLEFCNTDDQKEDN